MTPDLETAIRYIFTHQLLRITLGAWHFTLMVMTNLIRDLLVLACVKSSMDSNGALHEDDILILGILSRFKRVNSFEDRFSSYSRFCKPYHVIMSASI